MNFKYIKNISSEDATILLYGEIGSEINGSVFANEMQYLQDECKKIKVRINSIGGNVIDGYSIMSAILNSKVSTDTYIDGLAASIAGVIAMCGEKVYMSDYGTLMMHNPSGGSDQAVLNLVKGTLVTVFEKRTSLQVDVIDRMMEVETWMNASQAMEKGMIDEIVSSGKKVNISKSESLKNMVLIYNKIINPKKMNLITNKLGLSEDATEENAVESIEALQNKNAELLAEVEAGKVAIAEMVAEKQAIEDAKNLAIAEALDAKVEEMVNTFITSGVAKEEEKESLLKLAKVDFEGVKNMLSKVTTVKAAVKLIDLKNIAVKNGSEDRSSWTIRDWEKKDEKGLLKIKNESYDTYADMYHNFYKVYPKN